MAKTDPVKLRPCPFCGGKAELHSAFDGDEYAVVKCTKCDAKGAEMWMHDYSQQQDADAVKAWNERTR